MEIIEYLSYNLFDNIFQECLVREVRPGSNAALTAGEYIYQHLDPKRGRFTAKCYETIKL